MNTTNLTKKLSLITTALVLLTSACGPVSEEAARSQLNGSTGGTRQGSTQNSTSSISSLQVDSRGSIDLLYTITGTSGTSPSFSISVTRANGVSTSRLIALTNGENQNLVDFVNAVFTQSVTLISRTTCNDCLGYATLVLSRTDSSSASYSYPQFQNTSLENPLNQLNVFVLQGIR